MYSGNREFEVTAGYSCKEVTYICVYQYSNIPIYKYICVLCVYVRKSGPQHGKPGIKYLEDMCMKKKVGPWI